jgi:hypothetical protein
MKKNERGGALARMEDRIGVCEVSMEKPEGKRSLADLGIDGWIILNWILEKWDGEVWTGSSWLRIGTAGCCECGNELSGSIKCGEFLD